MLSNNMHLLTTNDWVLLTSKAERVVFDKDQTIIKEGAISQAIYILRKGTVRVQLGKNGSNRIATLVPGDLFGEMAFMEGTASASVIANELVEVDEVESMDLRRTFECFPHLACRFYQSIAVALSRRLRETSRQLSLAQNRASDPELPHRLQPVCAK